MNAWVLACFLTVPTTPSLAGMTAWDHQNLERNLRWLLERDRAGTDVAARIGVFVDAGVWHEGARAIVTALEGDGVACRLLDRSLMRPDVLAKLDVVILPGGWAPYQWGALEASGLAALRSFVVAGGRCVGICAGAYLLADDVIADSQRYPYPIGLFDGAAVGPVPGLAPFPEPGTATIRATDAGKQAGLRAERVCHYSGGPCFRGGSDVIVWARYHDNSPAIIVRRCGRGLVVACGIHAEWPLGPDGMPPRDAGPFLRTLIED